MTPCEERGFKVGDVLRVIEDEGPCNAGDVVVFVCDDDDDAPRVDTGDEKTYIALPNLEKMTQSENDTVNNPSHYQLLPGVEFKDVRRAILDNIDYDVPYTQIDDWSRVFEYVGRMWAKNGLEDAKKARVYLDWLIEKMEENEES